LGLYGNSGSSSAHRFFDAYWERDMVERTLVFGLLMASLTNVVCLYACL
jgi:hypothetical protein